MLRLRRKYLKSTKNITRTLQIKHSVAQPTKGPLGFHRRIGANAVFMSKTQKQWGLISY